MTLRELNELEVYAVGATFTVARSEGVYRKGDRWTIAAFRPRGTEPAGKIEVHCPDRNPLMLSRTQLAVLIGHGILAHVDPGVLERERKLVELKVTAPLRAMAPQHDHSGLALFQHFDEPRLL